MGLPGPRHRHRQLRRERDRRLARLHEQQRQWLHGVVTSYRQIDDHTAVFAGTITGGSPDYTDNHAGTDYFFAKVVDGTSGSPAIRSRCSRTACPTSASTYDMSMGANFDYDMSLGRASSPAWSNGGALRPRCRSGASADASLGAARPAAHNTSSFGFPTWPVLEVSAGAANLVRGSGRVAWSDRARAAPTTAALRQCRRRAASVLVALPPRRSTEVCGQLAGGFASATGFWGVLGTPASQQQVHVVSVADAAGCGATRWSRRGLDLLPPVVLMAASQVGYGSRLST